MSFFKLNYSANRLISFLIQQDISQPYWKQILTAIIEQIYEEESTPKIELCYDKSNVVLLNQFLGRRVKLS